MVILFGKEILNEDQTINRDKLGEIVFADDLKRRKLNRALHALIQYEMFKKLIVEFFRGTRFVILDVPLLFEAKFALYFVSYKLVVFCSDEEIRLKRLLARNPQLSESQAQARIQSQINVKKQIEMADLLIDNSKDLEHTKKQIQSVMKIFQASRKYFFVRVALGLIASTLFAGFYFFLKKFL